MHKKKQKKTRAFKPRSSLFLSSTLTAPFPLRDLRSAPVVFPTHAPLRLPDFLHAPLLFPLTQCAQNIIFLNGKRALNIHIRCSRTRKSAPTCYTFSIWGRRGALHWTSARDDGGRLTFAELWNRAISRSRKSKGVPHHSPLARLVSI